MLERDPNPFEHGTTRRTVLRAAGLTALVGGGGVLAAYSADAQVAAPPAASSAAPSASASSSAPASPSASASPSPSASSSAPAAPSGPSVATADVPVGGGVILDDAKYVVTQPTEGEFKAFSSI